MTKKLQDKGTKTYILNLKDGGRQRVTVPSDWKVSFGALFPSKDSNNGRTALRFWEGAKEHQRAVFADVESFRDTSIGIEEERTETHEQGIQADTELGKKTIIVRGQVREWINPDDPKASKAAPEFLRITNASSGASKKHK